MSNNDTNTLKENMRLVGTAFITFAQMIKASGKRDFAQWLAEMNPQGSNAVIKLLTWPVWFQYCKERLYIKKTNRNSILNYFSDLEYKI